MHLIFAALLLLARKELRQKRHSFTRFQNKLIMYMIIWHVLKYADNNKSFDEFLFTKLFLKRWQFRISLFSIQTMFFRLFLFFLAQFFQYCVNAFLLIVLSFQRHHLYRTRVRSLSSLVTHWLWLMKKPINSKLVDLAALPDAGSEFSLLTKDWKQLAEFLSL